MENGKTATHGDFNNVATLTMKLKDEIQVCGADALEPASREALDQILSRIARIVYGDQNHAKHWRDIQGFCQTRLDAAPKGDIETDIKHLVRSLPSIRMERSNAT
jgi:hypothetical protein